MRFTLGFALKSLIAVAFLLFTFKLVGCSSLVKSIVKEPKIAFDSVKLRDADAMGATAVIILAIENPNGVAITVDRLDYNLEIGGEAIAHESVNKIATIEKNATTKVEVPVPFKYNQIFKSLVDLISKGSAAYKVKGEAHVGVFNLPFDHTGDLKLRDR